MIEQMNRQELDLISRSLSKVHKALLEFQKDMREKSEQKALTPHEVLGLVLTAPDFEWLRMLSTLIVEMDEAVDDKKTDPTEVLLEMRVQIKEIFIDQDKHSEFKAKLMQAMGKSPDLWLCLADLRNKILT